MQNLDTNEEKTLIHPPLITVEGGDGDDAGETRTGCCLSPALWLWPPDGAAVSRRGMEAAWERPLTLSLSSPAQALYPGLPGCVLLVPGPQLQKPLLHGHQPLQRGQAEHRPGHRAVAVGRRRHPRAQTAQGPGSLEAHSSQNGGWRGDPRWLSQAPVTRPRCTPGMGGGGAGAGRGDSAGAMERWSCPNRYFFSSLVLLVRPQVRLLYKGMFRVDRLHVRYFQSPCLLFVRKN